MYNWMGAGQAVGGFRDAAAGEPPEGSAGRAVPTEMQWIKIISQGLPPEALESALEKGVLTWDVAERLILPRRTFTHRKNKSERLKREESSRLYRVLRVFAKAEETFGTREKAQRWLRAPNRALGGELPLDLLQTAEGAQFVERILGRIEHGVYS